MYPSCESRFSSGRCTNDYGLIFYDKNAFYAINSSVQIDFKTLVLSTLSQSFAQIATRHPWKPWVHWTQTQPHTSEHQALEEYDFSKHAKHTSLLASLSPTSLQKHHSQERHSTQPRLRCPSNVPLERNGGISPYFRCIMETVCRVSRYNV